MYLPLGQGQMTHFKRLLEWRETDDNEGDKEMGKEEGVGKERYLKRRKE